MLFALVGIVAAQGNNLSAPIKTSHEREMFWLLKNLGRGGEGVSGA